MSVPSVETRNLSLSYGPRKALDSVTFSVEEGDLFGLLGPNGGGKSSLFSILSTLRSPDSGEAWIGGRNVVEESSSVRAAIGVVFQAPALDKKLTVEENLKHHGRLFGISGKNLKDRVREALESCGLAPRTHDRVETLSGGLARRVEIAKVLVPRPRLLLLDEPSTGLDPGARLEFWNILEKARREAGVTVLLTTHLLEEADLCSGLGLLDRGSLVALGSPAALKAEIPGFVVSLLSRDPAALDRRLREEFSLNPQRLPSGCRFDHREPHKVAARITESCGALVESLTVGKPTLEDVFLRKTGHGLQ